MSKQLRSDDFIDGLQIAFGILHNLKQKCVFPERRFAYEAAMSAIDQAIMDASVDKPRIILP